MPSKPTLLPRPPSAAAAAVPGSLAWVAAGIDAHLRRLEADPAANRPAPSSFGGTTGIYAGAGASASGRYVMVKYVSYVPPTALPKAVAARYLAALDGGFTGRHFDAPDAAPRPEDDGPPRPGSLRDLAARVTARLRAIETDPAARAAAKLRGPSAVPRGTRLWVRYRDDDGGENLLSKGEALRYLAALDAGYRGRHAPSYPAGAAGGDGGCNSSAALLLTTPSGSDGPGERTQAPMTTPAPTSLRALADAIHAHLSRFEADPVVNAAVLQGGMSLPPFHNVNACANGRYVRVSYKGTLHGTNLPRAHAAHYLAGLDAGYVGSHFTYFAKHPPPEAEPHAGLVKALDFCRTAVAPPVAPAPPATPRVEATAPAPDGGPLRQWRELPQHPPSRQVETVLWRDLEDHLARQADAGLVLRPPWRRELAWSYAQQVRYVEHVLRGGESGRDLWAVCLSGEGWPLEGYALLDGAERLEAVRAFTRGEVRVFADPARTNGYAVQDFGGGLRRLPGTVAFAWRVLVRPTAAEAVELFLALNGGGPTGAREEFARARVVRAKLLAGPGGELPAIEDDVLPAEAPGADVGAGRPTRPGRRRLKWVRENSFHWKSECGRYHVWVQERPRDDSPHYAAEPLGEGEGGWLCKSGTFAEAKEACEEHLDEADRKAAAATTAASGANGGAR